MNPWDYNIEDFNQWRIENDLKELFRYFKKIFPDYMAWVKKYFNKESVVIEYPHPGDLFSGTKKKLYIEYFDINSIHRSKIIDSDYMNRAAYNTIKSKYKVLQEIEFLPYLQWNKKNNGKLLSLSNELNSSYKDDFLYGGWTSKNPSESRAALNQEFQVLKLGNIKLGDKYPLDDRNLDFCDLDNLYITGNRHSSRDKPINYSSCRNIVIENSNLAFIRFSNCPLNLLSIKDSRLQDIRFDLCDLSRPDFKDIYVNGFYFRNTIIREPNISNFKATRFNYAPHNDYDNFGEFQTLQVLRDSFEKSGNISEARKYYLSEKKYQRRYYNNPYWHNSRDFPSVQYLQGFKYWYDCNRKGVKSANIKSLIKLILNRINIFTSPKYAFKAISFKCKYMRSLFMNFLFGYGEKPLKVVINIVLIIFSFTSIFYFSIQCELSKKFFNSLYFSIVTFTTLGYGDIQPIESLKLICAVEAILGALFMGLFVGTLVNKARS